MARNITVDGSVPNKTALVDADRFILINSETDPDQLAEALFSVLKADLKTYFDTLYQNVINARYALHAEGDTLAAPVDATTYYIGAPFNDPPDTQANFKRIYIPKAGTITRVDLTINNAAGVAGTAENSTFSLRLNNTTDTLLSNTVPTNAVANQSLFYNFTGLAIAVVAGDYIEIKWLTPTWVTNPTNLRVSAEIFVE